MGYTPLSLLLHWFTVLWVGVMWVAGVLISRWDDTPDAVYDLHVTVGVLGFAVIVYRIVWRVVRGFASPNADHAGWERALARAVQWVFLTALSVSILTGLIKTFLGTSTQYFLWGSEIPKIRIVRMGVGAQWVETLHEIAAYALFFALILHVGGALKHVVLDRDGTLMRILKPSRPGK
ncbi:MAG: hypothetical protein CBC49_002480 [Alphaproteobacteria bacterium TMED89]|nr:MAG: hypothetical protein CBC49_002480 [Alphaproteobacteria bacterium TMED89]